jgi:hypothetical protein
MTAAIVHLADGPVPQHPAARQPPTVDRRPALRMDAGARHSSPANSRPLETAHA